MIREKLNCFRCKACNSRLNDEEIYLLDETDWMCGKCNQITIDAARELLGHHPLFDQERRVPLD